MTERGRSRNALSGDTSSQRTLRNSGSVDVSSSQYTEAWVESIRDQPNFEKQICSQISVNEAVIDAKRSIIQQFRDHICILRKHTGSEEEVTRWRSYIMGTEKQIEKCETALMSLGPCPIPDCVRHHDIPKDVEMVIYYYY
ncbi:hypothetical protein AVEN_224897-1 [Araneus ventricosus]|uniref:Uncharacterized protein n=1 Tax=Araneus ventricosus TaxID=182803 RepID=A0A4Y2AVR2_ARAVE|nr:hypothetical protein AVEN_224897-1 [Araneus ventricosus]